ncbi:MAG: hypothetical protein HY832_04215 [Candidatus Aenigmarchaeota archaeon]|nr:hypothetical protein [Candidatus Aenigmarchaeota archaeon]
MQKKMLDPNQIVALKDYPLRSEQILKIYFRVFQKKQGNILPRCPVIHISSGIPYMHGNDKKSQLYNQALDEFFGDHPNAEYFLVDGNHKSVAAALSYQRLPVIVLREKEDFKESKKMVETGEIFGWYAIPNSVDEELQELRKHFIKYFSQKPHFYTVGEKTEMLVRNNAVPKYMSLAYAKIGFYRMRVKKEP